MHKLAEELLKRKQQHYGGGGGPVKVNRRMSRKGPPQDKHGDAGPESMLMMIEDQADAEAPDHPDGADAAVDADLPGRDENDEVQPPATQEELFQDILRKHLFEHMQDTFEIGAWYSGPPISQRLTSHSTHLGLWLNTQLADVDGDVFPVEAVGAIVPRAVVPLDDVAQPNLMQALAAVPMVQVEADMFGLPQPDPRAEGSHFFFQVHRPSSCRKRNWETRRRARCCGT